MKKRPAFILCICLVLSFFSGTGNIIASGQGKKYNAEELIKITAENDTYDRFLIEEAYEPADDGLILLTSDSVKTQSGLVWNVEIPKASRYYIKIKYSVLTDSPSESECSLLVNGKLQYNELSNFILPKEYTDKADNKFDIYGNEITPEQILSKEETENYIFDYAGVYSEPLSVNLGRGSNEISFNYYSDEIQISSIKLVPAAAPYEYNEYIKANKDKKIYSGKEITVEGENAEIKSDTVLYPLSDKSSPKVSPSAVGKIVLNTIGGNNWKTANQYIKWNVEAPEEGLYTLSIKYKQNRNVGQQVRRAIYINGEIPFKEAGNLVFDYSSKWKIKTLGNDSEEYLFYLKKGNNEIKLTATLGESGSIIRAVDNCVTQLNAIYRKLLVVLGSEPDMAKDYKLDKNVPEVIESMSEMADKLDSAVDIYEKLSGSENSGVATLRAISRQLKKMHNDSDEIPSEFSYFKTNIGSLGTYQATAKQQPLEIDYFVLGGENPELYKAVGSFFENFTFGFKEFACSFVIDYKNIGSLEADGRDSKTITVWITSGRDQAQIIRNLISEDFTPKTGHKVKLELVSAASLLPATVAGIGPDVSIGLSSASVIDYSMRNAAYNLKNFEDFNEVSERFYDASFIPLEYMDGVYGLPNGMSFNVLYYRKDILADLGLEIPKTWDDVIAMSSVLSVNNMSFGLPSGHQTFLMMLRQKGLDVYSEDSTVCLLDSSQAIDVFQFYTNFYNNYGFPITYSLINRFRTGETPIAVDSIAIYNSLEISAPEIKGLWDFTLVPGFENENGEINNTTVVSGTSGMILKNSNEYEVCWEFLKWYTSADIQISYGKELESRLGSSGRYTSANKEALSKSCWNKRELSSIKKQLKTISAIEQVPGGYYLTRNLDNAFRNAVYYDKKPMDVMFDYVYKINAELTDKRKELGLTVANNK